MMGPKKLDDVRGQLRRALEADGGDAIHRLEQLAAEPKRQNAGGGSDVLQSLRRVLEAAKRGKAGSRRVRSKK